MVIDRLPAMARRSGQPSGRRDRGGGRCSSAQAEELQPQYSDRVHTPGEPVLEGLVASLNRRAGTHGYQCLSVTILEAKRLGPLHEPVPSGNNRWGARQPDVLPRCDTQVDGSARQPHAPVETSLDGPAR